MKGKNVWHIVNANIGRIIDEGKAPTISPILYVRPKNYDCIIQVSVFWFIEKFIVKPISVDRKIIHNLVYGGDIWQLVYIW